MADSFAGHEKLLCLQLTCPRKTGDFWLNGRLFGSQACHTTEDVEYADYVLFIGTNPFQAHGIPNARDTLKHIKKDPNRTMVVFDPRVTETAKQADIHVQLKPGTDAFNVGHDCDHY